MRRSRSAVAAAVTCVLCATPAVAQIDQHGKTHDLTRSPTRVTVVDFAAAWCTPCWKSLPRLQALADSMPDIDFLVVSVDDQVAGRDQLVSRIGLTLPVIWDESHVIAEHFQPQAMPATFVLDAEGTIMYEHQGYGQEIWNEFVQFLDQLRLDDGPGLARP